VKVGDYVKMPMSSHLSSPVVGVVTRTDADGINRGTPWIRRVQVLWLQDLEYSWEPIKWLVIINER